jgi:hypothetical protein
MSLWLILDATLLLLCVSMYLGTGWSLVLFSFPSRSTLRVDNYYDQFVPPVQRATRFFTRMTTVMIAAAIVPIVADRSRGYVIAPAIVLASRMAARITDERELQSVLGKWMFLNWIRVSLWTVQWFAIAGYFAFRLR